MKLQEGGCGVAGTSRDFAGVRSLGDAEQQADHQIAPEQSGEPFGKFGRTARKQSGRLGAGHDFTQGGAACLASYRVERTRRGAGRGSFVVKCSQVGRRREKRANQLIEKSPDG